MLQLEDKGASYSHFHPFKEFNKRLGIYSPSLTPVSPTLPDSHRTAEFQTLLARLIQDYRDKDIMSSEESIIDHIPLSNMMGKRNLL